MLQSTGDRQKLPHREAGVTYAYNGADLQPLYKRGGKPRGHTVGALLFSTPCYPFSDVSSLEVST